jgi:antitoxin HicB
LTEEQRKNPMLYPARLKADDNGTVLIAFPDVPGAVSFGDTADEAIVNGLEALLTMFDGLMKDKRDIPGPSAVKAGTPFVAVPALDAAKIELYRSMRKEGISKSELGRRLNVHLPQVDRILKVQYASQFEQMEAAFHAVGKRLVINVQDFKAPAIVTARLTRRAVPGAILTKAKSDRPAIHAGGSARLAKRASKKR